MRLLAALLLSTGVALAQAPTGRPAAPVQSHWITMVFDRPGLSSPHWEMVLDASGTIRYSGKLASGPTVTSEFVLSNAGLERLEKWLQKSNGMTPCESRAKGVANMGQRSITVSPAKGGPDLHCSFNFSDNTALSSLADYLIAVATTVQEGTELERLHRFDRLGLDATMKQLQNDAASGRAVEFSSIRPVLQSLVSDPNVLERVRVRAQQLLDLADRGRPTALASGTESVSSPQY